MAHIVSEFKAHAHQERPHPSKENDILGLSKAGTGDHAVSELKWLSFVVLKGLSTKICRV